jgi:hypothetical protein
MPTTINASNTSGGAVVTGDGSDASADAATWAAYRQALRDITTQANPFNITWPERM